MPRVPPRTTAFLPFKPKSILFFLKRFRRIVAVKFFREKAEIADGPSVNDDGATSSRSSSLRPQVVKRRTPRHTPMSLCDALCDCPPGKSPKKCVGWVERSETHRHNRRL